MTSLQLIIDVTQLINWQGKLTGIPRVMHELAVRYGQEPDVCLVVWSSVDRCYYEVSAQEVIERDKTNDLADSDVTTPPSLTRRLGSKLARTSPLVRKSGQAALRLRSRLTGSSSQELAQLPVTPQKGDRLFVLWGDWHDQSFIDFVKDTAQSGVKLAQIAYDMLPLVTPQYSGHSTTALANYARTLYPLCSVVLSISRHTKKDVTAWLRAEGQSIPPIKVVRLGDDFNFAQAAKPQHSFFHAKQDYIVCVGTIEARKNHTLLYYAYKLAAQQGRSLPKLVIVGRRGWKTDDIYELMTTDPETKDQFVFLHEASDEELSWLYQNSLFSIYPSFYEGWGLPVAESIARGTPCVASNTSSIPEIAGDLIGYFSPDSTDECLAAMLALQQPSTLRQATAKLKEYTLTSWDQTFLQVKKIIEEA